VERKKGIGTPRYWITRLRTIRVYAKLAIILYRRYIRPTVYKQPVELRRLVFIREAGRLGENQLLLDVFTGYSGGGGGEKQ